MSTEVHFSELETLLAKLSEGLRELPDTPLGNASKLIGRMSGTMQRIEDKLERLKHSIECDRAGLSDDDTRGRSFLRDRLSKSLELEQAR